MDGVPVTLPGLVRAQRLQEKAAYVGFDWEKIESVWEKVYEELQEIKLAQQENNKDLLEEEIGDAIFALVNLARFLGLPAEDAHRKTNNKFIMFPSTQMYYITNHQKDSLNFIQTITYEFI